MKRSNKTGGTSFHGVTLIATPQQLINTLGEPEYFFNDGSDKTNMDYSLETEDDIDYPFIKNQTHIAFTIYDWKEYQPLHRFTNYEFHIGASNHSQSVEAKNEVLKLLTNSN